MGAAAGTGRTLAGRALRLLLQGLGALTLLGGALAAGLLLTAGWWLKLDDEPRPADALVILAGDPRRAIHAAELYRRGLAPVIYLGSPRDEQRQALRDHGLPLPSLEEANLAVLALKGVPPQAVRVYGRELMSTVEEAEALGAALAPDQTRLLVVSSASHCRRARLILSAALPGRELIMSPTPYERFERKWWTHQGSASAVLAEVAKLAFYFVGTPFRSLPQAR